MFPSAAISLYQITCELGLPILAISQQNIFLFFLFLGVFSKVIPSRILKHFYQSKRPNEALDCNTVNRGGPVGEQNGLPSGHTMVSTFLFVYSLHEAIRIRNERGVFPWTVTLVTGLFFILMPIARVHIKCHTIPQVIAGIVLGTFWTCLFILFEQYVLLKWDRYVKDKKRFEDSFFET